MKNIIYLFTSILLITSCSDFLEEDPEAFFTDSNFYNSESDAVAAVNAIYAHLGSGNYYGGNNMWELADITTDLLSEGQGSTSERISLQEYIFNSSDNIFEEVWREVYESINDANVAIEKIPLADIDEVIKNRLVGEAKFLRALNYFDLLRIYGEVPLITMSTKGLDGLNVEKNSIDEIYTQIISDLEDAEQSGLEGEIIKGRVTDKAVKALLGKVLLYQYYVDGNSESLVKAIASLEAVIEPLTLSPSDVWNKENEASSEFIFSVQFVGRRGGIGSNYMEGFAVRGAPSPLTGFSSAIAEEEFLNSFADEDLRKEASARNSFIIDGETITFEPHVWKYFDASETNPSDTDINWPIIRMADVWLFLAEAENELNNGPTAKAYAAVNEVRNRAGLQDLPLGLSQVEFLDALVQERAWELCFEGQRWFDLNRTGKLIATISEYGQPIDASKHTVFPIPLRELDTNPSLVQNPGY